MNSVGTDVQIIVNLRVYNRPKPAEGPSVEWSDTVGAAYQAVLDAVKRGEENGFNHDKPHVESIKVTNVGFFHSGFFASSEGYGP